MTIKEIMSKMTVEEKAALCSGYDFWYTEGIERLNIPSLLLTDGPHGVRKQAGKTEGADLTYSVKATCFPTASATASSWDIELMEEIGVALGEEALQEEVAVLLGPGMNLKRSPLCGRNFEYFSEDPYLTGELAAGFVRGVQSKGVGTSLKHFAANNQEYRRMATESVLDERTLRELYLPAFEQVVKAEQPWTIMCAYNMVDGEYCSDSKKLLTDILRDEWGFDGAVMTDWGACSDRAVGVKAGLDLEMPGNGGVNDREILKAIEKGTLTEAELDVVVERMLNLIEKANENRNPDYKYDVAKHHQLARKGAANSCVLLKNDPVNGNKLLPLNQDTKIAVLGEFAEKPRYQGAGSSLIAPTKLSTILDGLKGLGIDYTYSPGYNVKTDKIDQQMIDEAASMAKEAEVVVVVLGLIDIYESEGFDREHLRIPMNHNALVEAAKAVNDNVVVVLQNGAPVEMPWINDVPSVLETYLGGQAGGLGTVDVLYGLVNPSGKLAETFPLRLEDDLATNWFAKSKRTVEYRESLYVGYRYYDKVIADVQFPFGYGLSYTTFEYTNITLNKSSMSDDETLIVTFNLTNTGDVAGAEVCQLYVRDYESTIFRPEKELKGFKKLYLEPGETAEVELILNQRAFAYYNVGIKDWHVESGEFEILVGASSRDIRLSESVMITSTRQDVSVPDYSEASPEYYQLVEGQSVISDNSFRRLLARELPPSGYGKKDKYTMNSTLEDVSNTLIGNALYKKVLKDFLGDMGNLPDDDPTKLMNLAVVRDMPMRSMVNLGSGRFNIEMAEGLLMMINGKYIKGLNRFLKHRVK